MAPVLILGGGPTGLFIGSLLSDQGVDVTILEKRREHTRKRPVKLLGRIFNTDLARDTHFFTEAQMKERADAIRSMKLELFCKTVGWLEMATPIQTIQEELKNYFQSSGGVLHIGEEFDISKINLMERYPNSLVVDCTGYHSVLRERIQPDNRITQFAEHVIVWTFLINGRYECDELCKYFKNRNTQNYQVIPSVNDTYVVEAMKTHVTCLITISEPIYDVISRVKRLTYSYLKESFSEICDDMDMFLANLTRDVSNGSVDELPIDAMEFVALPLHVYRAKKATHFAVDKHLRQPWILMGDSAMGGPYFQSISSGYEAAIYFAHLFQHMNGDVEQAFRKYEEYIEKIWLTLQFRSKEIKRNKELFSALCSGNLDALLKNIQLH